MRLKGIILTLTVVSDGQSDRDNHFPWSNVCFQFLTSISQTQAFIAQVFSLFQTFVVLEIELSLLDSAYDSHRSS